MTHKFAIDELAAGKRLDIVIADASLGLSRSQAKHLIESGRVCVDGDIARKAGSILSQGQLVEIDIPPIEKLDLTPKEVGIRILFEDEHLAVLEKPAGISVHPSETEREPTVVHGLLYSLKSLSSVGGVERPGIVHRIDKGTSGVLVVSKTDAAHLKLSEQFKAHSINRRYQALVYGDMQAGGKPSGRIETLFGRNPKDRKKMTGKLTEQKPGVRKAITHWSVIESFGAELTLVECRLETGRTHQIRVHLSEAGFPLVGDPTYGDHVKKNKGLAKKAPELAHACLGLGHQLLHARLLGFLHPVSGSYVEFSAPLPEDFLGVLELARKSFRKPE